MKFLLLLNILFITSCASISKNSASTITNIETPKMEDLFKVVHEKGKQYGEENVLIVFDIDNTILTMENMLGSDQWFSWQSSIFFGDKKACAKYCVAKSFPEMLDVQGKLFALAPMVPTERDLPAKIKDLQDKGYKVILLTSRGKEFRSSTQQQLKKNGYDLKSSALGNGFPGAYNPFTANNFSEAGLSDYDVKVAKLKKPRKVSYMNGVYMTAGQHKGAMLKALLHKTNSSFKAIIFADDHKKHTVGMSDTFKNQQVDLTTLRYAKIDPVVARFKKGSKTKVHLQWLKLKKMIKSIYK
jgi:hypothetical protein